MPAGALKTRVGFGIAETVLDVDATNFGDGTGGLQKIGAGFEGTGNFSGEAVGLPKIGAGIEGKGNANGEAVGLPKVGSGMVDDAEIAVVWVVTGEAVEAKQAGRTSGV